MRRIALQSAIGCMALSIFGMGLAVASYLPPLAGAVAQEFIDLFAVLNAVRVARPPAELTDFSLVETIHLRSNPMSVGWRSVELWKERLFGF